MRSARVVLCGVRASNSPPQAPGSWLSQAEQEQAWKKPQQGWARPALGRCDRSLSPGPGDVQHQYQLSGAPRQLEGLFRDHLGMRQ